MRPAPRTHLVLRTRHEIVERLNALKIDRHLQFGTGVAPGRIGGQTERGLRMAGHNLAQAIFGRGLCDLEYHGIPCRLHREKERESTHHLRHPSRGASGRSRERTLQARWADRGTAHYLQSGHHFLVGCLVTGPRAHRQYLAADLEASFMSRRPLGLDARNEHGGRGVCGVRALWKGISLG